MRFQPSDRPDLPLQRVVVEPARDHGVAEVGRQQLGGRDDLAQTLHRRQAAGVGEGVGLVVRADLRAVAGGGELGEVLHHGRLPGGEPLADGRRRGHDAVEHRRGQSLHERRARREHPLGPPRDPELVHDLLRRVLVDVVDHAAARELEQRPDPQQLRVVQVVDLRPLLQRRAEDPPHDPGRAVDPVARLPDADDGHARDRCRRRVTDDERDVVTGVGEALALPVEDPVVADGVDGRQVPDPPTPACGLARH